MNAAIPSVPGVPRKNPGCTYSIWRAAGIDQLTHLRTPGRFVVCDEPESVHYNGRLGHGYVRPLPKPVAASPTSPPRLPPLRVLFTVQSKDPENFGAWRDVGSSLATIQEARATLDRAKTAKTKWSGPGFQFRILRTTIDVIASTEALDTPPENGNGEKR